MRPSVRALMLLGLLVVPVLAGAQGTNNGAPVCTYNSLKYAQVAASDGAGGAIVVWQDYRGGAPDIYAARVLASGVADPAWPAGGLAVCTAADVQSEPAIVSDGAGGAFVTWQDQRSGYSVVYAQHVLAGGSVDPAWPADGLAVCTASSYEYWPRIVPDGAGGAIVAWMDYRSLAKYDVYAQHLLASGAVDPAWPVVGSALSTANSYKYELRLLSDGAGGAIAVWTDPRGGFGSEDIYAQRVLASGAVDGAWPADGRALCTAASLQFNPAVVSDGAGGAIVAWTDFRSGSYDIYAQRVLASGAVDGAWPADGRALCTAFSHQADPTIVSDGAGGAVVAWSDVRADLSGDVYAQHVLASGAVDGAWPADGRAVCTVAGGQGGARIAPDGTGGAIVTWADARGGGDIYAHHVLAGGAVDGAWPAGGRALCAADSGQTTPVIVPDGAGGAVVAWLDYRRGATDVGSYAQHVTAAGLLSFPDPEVPRITRVRDVPQDQGGRVFLTWSASALEGDAGRLVTGYRVWRRIPAALAEARARAAASEAGQPLVRAVSSPGSPGAAGVTYWEAVATLPAERLQGYGYTASTTQDSIAGSNPYTAFFVTALTASTTAFIQSEVDSGYSVDNLAPPTPLPFAATYGSTSNVLRWAGSRAADFGEFRLYRGASAGFVPSPATLVAATRDTVFTDAGGTAYYKLAAVDVHGNVSRYALVTPTLQVAALASLVRAETFADRIAMTWYVAGAGDVVTVYRRTLDSGWAAVGHVVPDAEGLAQYEDLSVTTGTRYGYRLGIMDGGAEAFAGEAWATPEQPKLALAGVWPNPSPDGRCSVQFELPADGPARIELFDITGRRLAGREVGSLGAGRHTVEVAPGAHLPPGIYLLRLARGPEALTARVAVTR